MALAHLFIDKSFAGENEPPITKHGDKPPMLKTQEPKYDMTPHGKLYNRESGNVIPDDEPVMVFRARDIHAAKAIEYYTTLCQNEKHVSIVNSRLDDFRRFAQDHQDRMKEPD